MTSPAVVFRTLRHLTYRQIRHQIFNRVRRAGSPPALPMVWTPPVPKAGRERNNRSRCFDGANVFTFNNEARPFAGNWNDPGARKLWLYNLHYMGWIFELEGGPGKEPGTDAGARSRPGREEWIRRWIAENPRRLGGNGWEPYPVSLRLFNWCKHYSLAGIPPPTDVLHSMGEQAAWLLDRLEYHLDGNHLLENLLALCFTGFFFDAGTAAGRRARNRVGRLLDSALASQFLPDGGHYELSPMYHAILLERILDLLSSWPLTMDPYPGLKSRLESVALGGLDWLEVMSVSGRFSLFNDSCYDAAPESSQLLEYGKSLLGFKPVARAPLRILGASGYFRSEAGPLTLIFDAGRLGPDHQMGHAQGDMLSLCLWLSGLPILVHPGNYEYLPGRMRDYCRATASHNTLVVDGREQAEWWSSHRVGWRGRPHGVSASLDQGTGRIRLAGSHDGFSRLPGSPIHRRKVELGRDSVEIVDTLHPSPGLACRVYFHFHPDCAVRPEKGKIRLSCPAGSMTLESDRPLQMEEGWHCPEFGLRVRNQVAVASFDGGECRTRLFLDPGIQTEVP